MILRNVKFDFKVTKGKDYKRYIQGYKAAMAALNVLDKEDDEYLIKFNEILDDFFADLLGNDYDQRLGIDVDDLEDLMQLLADFNAAANPEALERMAALQPIDREAMKDAKSSIPAPIPMPAAARPTTLSAEDIARARNIGSQIRGRFAQTLVGQDNLRESLITTLVAGGHILIESVPGLAKTTAAQTLATSVSGSFKRVQCTPDLMPSDLVGTQVFDFATQKFSTQIGPIHANFVLLDLSLIHI